MADSFGGEWSEVKHRGSSPSSLRANASLQQIVRVVAESERIIGKGISAAANAL